MTGHGNAGVAEKGKRWPRLLMVDLLTVGFRFIMIVYSSIVPHRSHTLSRIPCAHVQLLLASTLSIPKLASHDLTYCSGSLGSGNRIQQILSYHSSVSSHLVTEY